MAPDESGEAARAAAGWFGPRAEDYRTSASHADATDLARMLALLSGAPAGPALDVATGGGATARAVAATGRRTVATDVSRAMLDPAPEGAEPALAAAHALPFREGAFALVLCRIAAHHFADVGAFAREAARVLRAGGLLYIFDLTVPADAGLAGEVDAVERLRDPTHVRARSPAEWRAALDEAGLEVVRLERGVSSVPLEPWVRRARLDPEPERELRRRIDADLGGYGAAGDRMRLLRVEVVARKR